MGPGKKKAQKNTPGIKTKFSRNWSLYVDILAEGTADRGTKQSFAQKIT